MILEKLGKKYIDIDEIERLYKIHKYNALVELINKLVNENKISPIKNSGGNGKSPALYKRYRLISCEEDNKELLNEIQFKLSSKFNIEYYENHLDKYIEHRDNILKLNKFVMNNSEALSCRVSMNERAFEIWGREKFLQKEGGKTILKNLGLELEFLNYYDTSEPLAYFSRSKEVPQNILIIENKDTYYTIRNHLINNKTILGKEIGTIIYGKGKGALKAFNDFEISVEAHISSKENVFLYFGDLDYEGILIYEGFYESFSKEYTLLPFIEGYIKMLDKARILDTALPQTKDGQNRNIGDLFSNEFSNENHKVYLKEINDILQSNLYIPQEIINITDI